MSGGSYDYAYQRVNEMAENLYLERRGCKDTSGSSTVLRRAFAKHLLLVAKAMRACEWNDSGDGDSAEGMLIRQCLSNDAALHTAIELAEAVIDELRAEISTARGLMEENG